MSITRQLAGPSGPNVKICTRRDGRSGARERPPAACAQVQDSVASMTNLNIYITIVTPQSAGQACNEHFKTLNRSKIGPETQKLPN